MEFASPIEYWNDLAVAVDEGQLFLDPEAAHHCDAACNEYLGILREQKSYAERLSDVRGMGSFDSGIALARKFSLKAAGGTNNLVDVLQSHIDVVMAMQTVSGDSSTPPNPPTKTMPASSVRKARGRRQGSLRVELVEGSG